MKNFFLFCLLNSIFPVITGYLLLFINKLNYVLIKVNFLIRYTLTTTTFVQSEPAFLDDRIKID